MKFLKVILFICILSISSSAFAIMNIEAYSGYNFFGGIDNLDTKENISGFGFGFRGDFLYRYESFSLGFGGYGELSPLFYKFAADEYALTKITFGVDSFARWKVPNYEVMPYIRGGFGLYDRSETKLISSNNIAVNVFSFNSYYMGGGIAYSVIPLPVINVQVFCEYLYNISQIRKNSRLEINKINIGLIMAL